jgi:hypothetical protein
MDGWTQKVAQIVKFCPISNIVFLLTIRTFMHWQSLLGD